MALSAKMSDYLVTLRVAGCAVVYLAGCRALDISVASYLWQIQVMPKRFSVFRGSHLCETSCGQILRGKVAR